MNLEYKLNKVFVSLRLFPYFMVNTIYQRDLFYQNQKQIVVYLYLRNNKSKTFKLTLPF